jgi:hypothetical protein
VLGGSIFFFCYRSPNPIPAALVFLLRRGVSHEEEVGLLEGKVREPPDWTQLRLCYMFHIRYLLYIQQYTDRTIKQYHTQVRLRSHSLTEMCEVKKFMESVRYDSRRKVDKLLLKYKNDFEIGTTL